MVTASDKPELYHVLERKYEIAMHAEESSSAQSELDFAQFLSEQTLSAVRSGDETACCQLLRFASNAFQDPRGSSMMDNILYEVFSPLLDCGRFSPPCHQAFLQLVDVLIQKCSARELLTLFLASLDLALR